MSNDVEVPLQHRIGLIGASSLVGGCLLDMLAQSNWSVLAYSRRNTDYVSDCVEWRKTSSQTQRESDVPFLADPERIPLWIYVAPIWTIQMNFKLLEAHGVRRIVVLSSTSIFTKDNSSDPAEQEVAARLADGEAQFQTWAESKGVEWIVIRPTLIYGLSKDHNLSEIVRFVRLFGIFPICGKALGLREPVHAYDVAAACMGALLNSGVANHVYNISGGETLTYHEMVMRVFSALGKPARILHVPLWVYRLAMAVLRWLPRYRHWNVAMAERMNRDLVFDHGDAVRDFGFKPRRFILTTEDVKD